MMLYDMPLNKTMLLTKYWLFEMLYSKRRTNTNSKERERDLNDPYWTVHLPCVLSEQFSPSKETWRACSKSCLTPVFVSEEHSMYVVPISAAFASPSSHEMHSFLLSRRSVFVPTRR